jgi:hypothetical protein
MQTATAHTGSLFRTEDSQTVISRINALTSDSMPLWGKMNVAQMLFHCQQPLKSALGELPTKHRLIGRLFGSFAKKKILGDGGFGKNLPTDPLFVITDKYSFDEERHNLITLLERFLHSGPGAITKKPHPFFGKLSAEEWDTLQLKHLDHHLRQFGV